jgi:hypothetical protein
MTQKIKISLIIVGLLIVLGLVAIGSFYIGKANQGATQQVVPSVDNVSGNNIPTSSTGTNNSSATTSTINVENEKLKSLVCGGEDIKNIKPIENNKEYVTMSSSVAQVEAYHYNDYLFCKMFSGGQSGDILTSFIGSSDGNFSRSSFASRRFIETNTINTFLKSKDCNSKEVEDAVNGLKGVISETSGNSFENSFKNVSSSDICEFFKKVPATLNKLEASNFCSGSMDCQALMDNNIALCDNIKSEAEGSKVECKDTFLYQQALLNGDVTACLKLATPYKQIACQTYFLENRADMCDGLLNEINDSVCK